MLSGLLGLMDSSHTSIQQEEQIHKVLGEFLHDLLRILQQNSKKIIFLKVSSFFIEEFRNSNQSFLTSKFQSFYYFINITLFAFRPSLQGYQQFFELNSISIGEFAQTKVLQIKGADRSCDCFFPSVYNTQKGLMLSKNDQNLNIIQFSFGSQDWDCKLQWAIEFETQKYLQGRTYGTISADGNFIVTQYVKSKEIQIRRYKSTI
ncbi:unnamed protein product [Paramecium octaurelia]|uniref:Uncharacterized protein n=1 Tax=Paramecium octaurelia TaxID=43137 RepID=A0A8S1W3V1_PAROT|nr:unnamed protein product [Paramecium octaurelia]